MGAQGIRRRKKRRDLPEVEGISEGDVGRLFGRFSWGAYTPAGTLERNGFLLRQFKRNGGQGAWSFLVQAKWVFAAFAMFVVAVAVASRVL